VRRGTRDRVLGVGRDRALAVVKLRAVASMRRVDMENIGGQEGVKGCLSSRCGKMLGDRTRGQGWGVALGGTLGGGYKGEVLQDVKL